jgi:hypothetical protein
MAVLSNLFAGGAVMNAKTVAAVLVSVTLVGVAACGDDSQSPVLPSPIATPPTPIATPPAPVLTSLTISGKTSSAGVGGWQGAWLGMVPGETARLTATATFSNNTERDVTAETVWTCHLNKGSLSVVSPGVIRAQVPGWEDLFARYGSAQSSSGRAEAHVRVAPEGVFLLDILVVDDDQWVTPDALVQVTSAAGAFSVWTSIWSGITLPVVGDTVLQVEKAGYVTIRKSMTVSSDLEELCILRPSGTAPFTATGR